MPQTNLSPQRQQQMCPISLRSFITCFLMGMLLIYSLHSSKIIALDYYNSTTTTTTTTDNNNISNYKHHHNSNNDNQDLKCPLIKENTLSIATNNATSTATPDSQIGSRKNDDSSEKPEETQLKHVVFGIAASSSLWQKRKEYIKLWWRKGETRGVVWLDRNVRVQRNENLPEVRISGDTSKFQYTNRQGQRSALRISRVVSETIRLGMKDVRWFVMGDDDTVFVVENVLRVLSKYDHNQFYYIGSSSESHIQNIFFSYAMAYGGGGFAISYPLAKELERMQDRCIQRYPGLYGSDDRIQACMAELGVPLTKESGFHQYDVYGNLLGLLAAHPVSPLVSLHHLDVVDPIFPGLSQGNSVRRLLESVKHDSSSIVQQSFCYDKKRYWSIIVSWGYVVQVIRGSLSPRELEMPTRTFLNWYKRADYTAYAFNTRPVAKHPCQKPVLFYLSSVRYDEGRRQIIGVYNRYKEPYPYCRWKSTSPETLNSIVVLKRPDDDRWKRSPRRDCCRILPSRKSSVMYLWVGNCRQGEVTEL